jgi:hypothetical protein
MKCIKSIKSTKNTEIGVIKRIDDKEAESMVKSGYWKYVPKSEFKIKKVKEDETLREQYPANVEGSKEFNKANKKNNKKVSK